MKLLKSSEMLKKGANTFVHCKWSKMLNMYLLAKKPHNHLSSDQL